MCSFCSTHTILSKLRLCHFCFAGEMNLFSLGILLQCWLSSFFVGKVNEGTFAAGFKYSAMLVLTAHVSLALSQSLMGGMLGMAPRA